MNLYHLIEKFDVYVLSSFLCSSVVQVKFSQSLVATTEEEGQVLVTVEAMGDLSSDFSIIVMAINGSAVGKLLSRRLAVQTHVLTVVCSRPPNQLNVNFYALFFSEPFDFTGNMWPVDFLANHTSSSFPITIVQDNLPETREEFSLKIVIESPYDDRVTVGEPSRLTVVITSMYGCTCQCICMYVCMPRTINWEQLPLTVRWQGRFKRQRLDLQRFGSRHSSYASEHFLHCGA